MGEVTNIAIHMLLFMALYFEVFLLITFFEARRSEKYSQKPILPLHLPSVTIMVPCYNEEQGVTRTIFSLLRLDYPRNLLTIFVIDDGSTDHTWNVLQRFKNNKQVTLFQKENGGKHTALNAGLERITTELVGCLDADSYVESNALKELVRYFSDKEVMCVTPAIKLHNPKTIFERIQKAEYGLSVFIRKIFSHMNALFITPGPFSIFRKSVFDTLGNYREAHHTEDMEIALRMQVNHYKIANAPSARVYTNAPRTWRDLFRQRLRWTYGFLQNARDYRFIFFKKEYGTLGLFILPMAVFSIFPALFFSAILIDGGINLLFSQVERIRAIGFTLPATPSFDPFFISTQSVLFIVYTIVLFSLLLIMIGKHLSNDRRFGIDVPLYLFLYGFLAPWWLSKGILDSIRTKKQSWTHEIDTRS